MLSIRDEGGQYYGERGAMRPLKFAKTWVVWLFLFGSAWAQDWGPMQCVFWENPPISLYGYFNPSYCDADSILYFDNFCRIGWELDEKIYSSRLDGARRWSDPEELPGPINIEGYRSVMPCINTGGDTLLFSSDRPGTRGSLDIWISIKNNGEWSEPLNLGDSINTELAEMKPYFTKISNALYFERMDLISPYRIRIYKSTMINDIWQLGQILPEIINTPELSAYGTFFYEQENALYFTSGGYGYILPLKKSILLNSEWQTPQELGNNINGFWYPNYCDAVETGDAWISNDRQFLFYDKWIWEASYCIDFYSYIFFSENTVDIKEEDSATENNEDFINIFPNPSNSTFRIEFKNFDKTSELNIYNIMGQLVNEFDLDYSANTLEWDCRDINNIAVNSGVYFIVINYGGESLTKKIVLLK